METINIMGNQNREKQKNKKAKTQKGHQSKRGLSRDLGDARCAEGDDEGAHAGAGEGAGEGVEGARGEGGGEEAEDAAAAAGAGDLGVDAGGGAEGDGAVDGGVADAERVAQEAVVLVDERVERAVVAWARLQPRERLERDRVHARERRVDLCRLRLPSRPHRPHSFCSRSWHSSIHNKYSYS